LPLLKFQPSYVNCSLLKCTVLRCCITVKDKDIVASTSKRYAITYHVGTEGE